MEFDNEAGRCGHCDGHYTHTEDCPTGIRPSILSLQDRIEIRRLTAGLAQGFDH